MRYATRVLGRPEVARDIVQETWIGAIRGLKRLEYLSHFPAWIYSIAHRKSVDGIRLRRRQRRLKESVEHEAAVAVADDQSRPGRSEGADLDTAISQLSQEQREVVHLFYGADLSIDDIASVLAVPPVP